MRTFFLLLVALVTVVGMFVQNAEQEAAIVKAYVESAYNYMRGHIEENPEQVAASSLTMVLSTVIWLSILRITRSPSSSIDYLEFKGKTENKWSSEDSPTIAKAKAQQLYHQLEQNKAVLKGRQRWIPEEIERAKKELHNAELEQRNVKIKYDNANENVDNIRHNLKKLVKEYESQEVELQEIEDELERLRGLI